jgi:hypothetical protein
MRPARVQASHPTNNCVSMKGSTIVFSLRKGTKAYHE